MSFGVAELTRNFHEERDLIVRNHEHAPATFSVAATGAAFRIRCICRVRPCRCADMTRTYCT
jgi:hypothetical protein